MNQKITFWIKWILGLVILVFLFQRVGFSEVYHAIRSINPGIFIIFLFLFILQFFMGVFNINILISFVKKISFFSLIKPYFYSWAIGMFGPSKIGEFSFPFFLKKYSINFGTGTAILLIDKLITLLYLAIISAIALALFNIYNLSTSLIILFISLIFLGIIFFSLRVRVLIRKYVLRKFEKKLSGFSSIIFNYIKKGKKHLIANASLTIFKLFIGWISSYFLFLALGERVPLLLIILIGSVAWISGLIPITISGLGIKQSVALFLYTQAGISGAVVLANQAIVVAVNYAIASLFLFDYLISKKNLLP